jgi:hypothetical protein
MPRSARRMPLTLTRSVGRCAAMVFLARPSRNWCHHCRKRAAMVARSVSMAGRSIRAVQSIATAELDNARFRQSSSAVAAS